MGRNRVGNAQAFAILHAKGLRQVPSILEQCSGEFTLREAKVGDAVALAGFFADQPEERIRAIMEDSGGEATALK